jgi:hypothetical protein
MNGRMEVNDRLEEWRLPTLAIMMRSHENKTHYNCPVCCDICEAEMFAPEDNSIP